MKARLKKNCRSSIVHRRCGGFSLIEATVAMVMLAVAAAGVLLPFSSAAAAQVEAQRRVVATRFAANVVESLAAGQTLVTPVLPSVLGCSGTAYLDLSCDIQTQAVVGFPGLTYVSVAVKYKQSPITTLKTLVGN